MTEFIAKDEMVIKYGAEQMEQEAYERIRANAQKLKAHYKVKQKDIAEKTGISTSTISKLLGSAASRYPQSPSLDMLSAIASYFNISLYELCFTDVLSDADTAGEDLPINTKTNRSIDEYDRFLGTYEGIYFDTSRPIGEDNRPTPASFSHVILTIYKNISKKQRPEDANRNAYKVAAIFNCSPDLIQRVASDELHSASSGNYIEQYYRRLTPEYPNIYWGDISLTDQFIYIDVKQKRSRDIVHIILHNKVAIASPLKKYYVGGLGIMASSSRGAERMPCAQQILLSKYPLADTSDEEIAEMLYISTPKLSLHESAHDLIAWVKALYTPDETSQLLQGINDKQKEAAVEVQLSRINMEQMRKNAFRYHKISSNQDNLLYHRLEARRKNAN